MVEKYNQVDESGGAIVCKHVTSENLPILRATRDRPLNPEDSGWQFLCNTGRDETDAEIWSVNEVLELEPSLSPFINNPSGTQLVRNDKKSQWKISK